MHHTNAYFVPDIARVAWAPQQPGDRFEKYPLWVPPNGVQDAKFAYLLVYLFICLFIC